MQVVRQRLKLRDIRWQEHVVRTRVCAWTYICKGKVHLHQMKRKKEEGVRGVGIDKEKEKTPLHHH